MPEQKDYTLTVLKKQTHYRLPGKTSSQTEVSAGGVVMSLPKSDFAEGVDFEAIFRRWSEMNSRVTINPTGDATPDVAEDIFRVSKIDEDYVCGTLIGGQLDLNGDVVTLNTNVVPYGPYGEDLAQYMASTSSVSIRPRFILDADGKVTGVPAWDMVLPRDWNARPYTYNSVQDENFIGAYDCVLDACRIGDIKCSLVYNPIDDSWHFTLSSPVESENFTGEGKKLCHALEDVIAHLDNLGK